MNVIFLLPILLPSVIGDVSIISNLCGEKHRLSGNVKPTFYSITIHPDIDQETFTGEVFIHIKVDFAVDSIELHSKNLNITNVYFNTKKVLNINDRRCDLAWTEMGYEFLEQDLIRIRYGRNNFIPPGSHIVQIKYQGNFSKSTNGLFKTGFSKSGTILSQVIATDFEPNRARQVFPCFDEPSFKAKFQLTLVVPNDTFVALSNMRMLDKFQSKIGVFYKFETTPPMSTYLLSFVISQHTCKEYFNHIPFRVCSFNGTHENNTRFLEFSSKVIKFYENYTDFNYTLPKIDFVGFDRAESSATENWGLVTFNSSLLSPDDDVYDDSQKFTVIAHELAHFWFGNLVTNDWWDGIWLQEGFATFMSVKAEELILKNNASLSFPLLYTENLLWRERTHNMKPVVHFVNNSSKIRDNFNDIVYTKAAIILRMLETAVGEDVLRQIIIKYIHKFAFETVNTNDFLSIIETLTCSVHLREFMESFLYQNKYPVLYVKENGNNFVITQKCCNISKGRESPLGYKWTIPVTYTTNLNNMPTLAWFSKDMANLTLPKNNAMWIQLNYQQIGYYRVNYDKKLWDSFILYSNEIPSYERNLLLLEGVDMFEMNLMSCDVILKFSVEMVRYRSTVDDLFTTEYLFIMYIKLKNKIRHDKEAVDKLKEFYASLTRATRGKRLAEDFSINDNQSESYNELKEEKSEESVTTKFCVEWLKAESQQYLKNNYPEQRNNKK